MSELRSLSRSVDQCPLSFKSRDSFTIIILRLSLHKRTNLSFLSGEVKYRKIIVNAIKLLTKRLNLKQTSDFSLSINHKKISTSEAPNPNGIAPLFPKNLVWEVSP